jgi:hypothetical protein
LSARYSSSPALHLRIGESRLRSTLYYALCLACVYALWLVFTRGYVVLVVLLIPLVAVELCWRQGRWTLERAGVHRVIVPTRRSTATPWVIYLAFSDLSAGRGGYLWLYADSASKDQLRRLRVRLTLDC